MIAILVAGGSSRRMGFDKLTAPLAGRPVLAHALLAFERCAAVRRIVLVAREERREEFAALAREAGVGKLAGVVAGGAERHLSVWNGLRAAGCAPGDYVAIHDAARPLVTPSAIEGCLALARRHGAAACATPVADTLKRAGEEGVVVGSVERERLWAMQTPQIFLAEPLERAYKEVLQAGEGVTDEVSALQRLGCRVVLYDNEEPNFKITLPRDLELARLLLARRDEA